MHNLCGASLGFVEPEHVLATGRRHENGLDEKKGGVGARGHKTMRNWHSTSSVTTTAKNENKTREDQVFTVKFLSTMFMYMYMCIYMK